MTTKGDENELLRSVALQNATSILAARRRAERRSEVYLAEAQRLSHTGSFGWKPSTGEIIWSEETFRIFQYDRSTKPTAELVLQRVHPEDVALKKQILERASQEGKDFDFEHRLLMPDASVKHIHVVARAERDDSGELEFVGAVMDVSDRKRAEEELRRSEALAEQRLRLVVDTTPAMINSCRPDGHLDYVNKGWLDYFGFSLETALDRADVMKMSVPSKTDRYGGDRQPIIHPEDLQGFRDQWKATLASSKPGEHEARVRRFDGVYRWHLFRAVPLYDETGKPVKWYTSAFDIEDRKRVEVLLAGEKRLLEMIARGDSRELILEGACLLVEELASGCLSSILLLDPNANCLRHGAAPSLPKPYIEAIDGAVVGPSAGSCGTAAYRTEPVIVSDIATDPLWANYRDLALAHGLRACWSTPILSSEGKVLGTFAIYYREPRSPAAQDHSVIRQITHLASIAIERKQAEEALRRSEGYLAEAQRLTRTGSWAWNVASRRSIYWSQENYRLFGFDPEEGIPSDEVFYQRVHPEDRDRVRREVFLERPEEGSHFDVEFRIVLPDGAIEYVRSTGHPVRNISGDLLEYVGTSIDVTERKRADEERERLRQAQADLVHVNRVTTMGELTASLAHEVNQPIAAAITNANTCMRWLAADTPNLEEARAAAMRIVKDGTRAAEIIKRVRLLFKKGTPERELVDLNEVVRDMIVLLRSEATRYSISVRTKLAADLPEVVGDRVQLQQVLMNLMINGIDAMRDVDGTRELVVKSERGEYEQALVSVSDTGVGLPQQQADQIFNAFFTTKSHGTGMGLRISRSIVESYGGRLWAAENSPRGASFYVTLPTKAEALE